MECENCTEELVTSHYLCKSCEERLCRRCAGEHEHQDKLARIMPYRDCAQKATEKMFGSGERR